MPDWAPTLAIQSITRICLTISGILFLGTFGRALKGVPFWALLTCAWIGFLAEWIAAEQRRAIQEALEKQSAPADKAEAP